MKFLSKKFIYIFTLALIFIAGVFYVIKNTNYAGNSVDIQIIGNNQSETNSNEDTKSDKDAPIDISKKVEFDVPFTAQAPFGDWGDIRQQNGCEEASLLMAISYMRGQSFTQQGALDEILKMDAYAEANYGFHLDISAKDTVQLAKDYFNYTNVEYKTNITVQDIKMELYKGNLVIVPADGRILNNPYFSGDGPEYHMLVIVGYDPFKDGFITNDPGTRNGKGFRYSPTNLYSAIADYPSGYHIPRLGISKTMIVIGK